MDRPKLEKYIVHLDSQHNLSINTIGGKALHLMELIQNGYCVASGFTITVDAYKDFINAHHLDSVVNNELGRKVFESMRWEEVWDASLRIRSEFLTKSLNSDLITILKRAYDEFNGKSVIVRSSSVFEDGSHSSFAGIHESVSKGKFFYSIYLSDKKVWASLWSDAALIYREELGLDIKGSAMAVVVQEYIEGTMSGIAFSQDPRQRGTNCQLIEMKRGSCESLVSGHYDPWSWVINKDTDSLQLLQKSSEEDIPMDPSMVQEISKHLEALERIFKYPVDIEWTIKDDKFILLQLRPISSPVSHDPKDKRPWYLSLTPDKERMKKLCEKVSEELIPSLQKEIEDLKVEDLEQLNNLSLAKTIEKRNQSLNKWQKIYYDEFIPFAHGVRQFGMFYNDCTHPSDPFEFVNLLRDLPLLANKRDKLLYELKLQVKESRQIKEDLSKLASQNLSRENFLLKIDQLVHSYSSDFWSALKDFYLEQLRVVFQGEALDYHPTNFIQFLLELSKKESTANVNIDKAIELEKKFLSEISQASLNEAKELLELAKISWRLRDDDNILMGQLEYELLRALRLADQKLRQQNIIIDIKSENAELLSELLINPNSELLKEYKSRVNEIEKDHVTPRQMCGQPAAGGFYVGKARVVNNSDDLANFKLGEVLICDAIEPQMTFVVAIAGAIVERRGGMLIHGAIIAREFSIPCVNGVTDAMIHIKDGDEVTVDGYLGIVSLGKADFDLEFDKVV